MATGRDGGDGEGDDGPVDTEQKDEKADGEAKKKGDSEPISLAELSQLEEDASKRVMDRLMLPSLVGRAVTAFAWGFVILGFLLNLVGYDYVRDPDTGWLTVDTLEKSQFEKAKINSMRQQRLQEETAEESVTKSVDGR